MSASAGRMVLLSLFCLALVGALALLVDPAAAEGGPPTKGDWNVTERYVLEDRSVMLRGDVTVQPGGELIIRNSTLMFFCSYPDEHGLGVEPEGVLRVLNGSILTSSRPSVQWTWYASLGSTLEVRDSTVEWCGMAAWSTGNPRLWGLCVETLNATIDGCRFTHGFIGVCYPNTAKSTPVRNCTFETYYGVYTWGTDVEGCLFKQGMTRGVWIFAPGGNFLVSDCTFEGIRTAGVEVNGDWRETVRVVGCTFKDSARGLWVINTDELTVEACTFDGMVQQAIYVDRSTVHIVGGQFVNLSMVVYHGNHAIVDWTVNGMTEVRGATVMISGDLVLTEGAHLRLLGCQNFSMLSPPAAPLSIVLGKGAMLELVSTDISVPDAFWGDDYGAPVNIIGPNATLSLDYVKWMKVAYPVELGELRGHDSRVPLGVWNVRTVHLDGCTLAADPGWDETRLVVSGETCSTGVGRAGELVRCALDGIPVSSPSRGPWLSIGGGLLNSSDFLHDLGAMIASGEVLLPAEAGVARLEARWSVAVEVHWQNGRPVPGASVVITDRAGREYDAMTDLKGRSQQVLVCAEEASSASLVGRLCPLTVHVSSIGFSYDVTVPVLSSILTVPVIFMDTAPPVLSVDQGDFVGTKAPVVAISGTARDLESGIAYLEARLEPRAYTLVPVGPGGRFELSALVSPGLQTVVLRLYDQAGNRAERRVVIYHSTTPPRIFSVEPQTGTIVNTTHISITGETEQNTTVEVLGRAQLSTNGTFRILVTLEEGENQLAVNFSDLAGNVNRTLLRVVRDSAPPRLVVTAPATSPYLTREARQVIEGIAEVGCIVLINSVEMAPDPHGAFSARVSLREGPLRFVVTAIDRAGNLASKEVEFVLDTQPPTLVVLSPAGLETKTNMSSMVLMVQVGTDAILTLDGESVSVDSPTVRMQLDLTEGENRFVLRAIDPLGNEREVTLLVRSHRLPPVLALVPPPPQSISNPSLKIAGLTEPGTTVTINGLPVRVDGDGKFSRTLRLPDGRVHIVAVATDEFGNVATISYDIDVGPVPPRPVEPSRSLLPTLLASSAIILAVEGVVLLLWQRRKRQGGRKG